MPMWVLNRIVNPLVRALLRSPLHPLLSGRLLLLRVTGRRSGRTFEVPVGSPERKQWWRNIDGPTPITLALGGRTRTGVAELLDSGATMQVHIALPNELLHGRRRERGRRVGRARLHRRKA